MESARPWREQNLILNGRHFLEPRLQEQPCTCLKRSRRQDPLRLPEGPIEPSFLQNIKVAALKRHWDFFPIGHRFDRWNSFDVSKICLAHPRVAARLLSLPMVDMYVCMYAGR